MFCSRTTAVKKLGLPSKIFDWVCFLNVITTFCPRRQKNGKNSIYFSFKNIQEISKDPIFLKTRQLLNWKKINKKNPRNKTISNINLPNYSIYNAIKKRFPSFQKALGFFSEIFPFFFLDYEKKNHLLNFTKISGKFNILSSKCFHVIQTASLIKGIVETRDAFHIGVYFLKKKKKIFLPINNYLFPITEKGFHIPLIRFYLVFFEFAFSKLFCFQNYIFLDFYFYFFKNNPENFFKCPPRFYTKFSAKKNETPEFLLRCVKKNRSIYEEFNAKIRPNIITYQKSWICSMTFLFPSQLVSHKSLVFCLEKKQKTPEFEFTKSFFQGGFTFFKNEKNLTHFIIQKKGKSSLLALFTDFSWVKDSINSKSLLPISPYFSSLLSGGIHKKLFGLCNFKFPIFSSKESRILIGYSVFPIHEKKFSKSSHLLFKKNVYKEKKRKNACTLFSLIKLKKFYSKQ